MLACSELRNASQPSDIHGEHNDSRAVFLSATQRHGASLTRRDNKQQLLQLLTSPESQLLPAATKHGAATQHTATLTT